MSNFKEAVEWNFKNGFSPIECHRKITLTHGPNAISKSTVRKYFRDLKTGTFTHDRKKMVSRPSSSKNEEILKAINENPSLSLRKLRTKTIVSKSHVHRLLRESGLRSKFNEWEPHELTPQQCQKRV